MRILIVKLTSLGDVIHALPAITDAKKAYPDLSVDFLVDETFSEIPAWHSGVDNVITVANRRWRGRLLRSLGEIRKKCAEIRSVEYDHVIDLQGLLKSSLWLKCARGRRHGYAEDSIKEPIASKLYDVKHHVSTQLHAIERNRTLLSNALAYKFEQGEIDYGVSTQTNSIAAFDVEQPYWVFLHGTAWASKQWPESYWQQLMIMANESGRHVVLPWGNPQEKARAERLAKSGTAVTVLPKLSLSDLVPILSSAEAIASVDTGLGHLAAALDKPTVAIYGPTDTKLVGILGKRVSHLCAEMSDQSDMKIKTDIQTDFSTVPPQMLFEYMERLIATG